MISENSPRVVIASAVRVDRRTLRSKARPPRKPLRSFVGVVTTTAAAMRAATPATAIGSVTSPIQKKKTAAKASRRGSSSSSMWVTCVVEETAIPTKKAATASLTPSDSAIPATATVSPTVRRTTDSLVSAASSRSNTGVPNWTPTNSRPINASPTPTAPAAARMSPPPRTTAVVTARYTAINRSS